jgi:hypothetical protein
MGCGCRRSPIHWNRNWQYHRRCMHSTHQPKLSLTNEETRQRKACLARSSIASNVHWRFPYANSSFLVFPPHELFDERFAWTSYPTLPWIAFVLAGIPFGLAQILLFLSIMNYIADCYLQFAASALAANSLLRSVLGATFPLWAP